MKGSLPFFLTAFALAALILLSALLGTVVDDLFAFVAVKIGFPVVLGLLLLAWFRGGRGAGAAMSIKVSKDGLTLLAEVLGVLSFVITIVMLVAKP